MTRITDGAALISLLVLGQSIPDGGSTITEIAARFGLPVAGLALFVWWSRQDRNALAARIQQVEDDRVKLLTDAIERNTAAMNRMADTAASCPNKKEIAK